MSQILAKFWNWYERHYLLNLSFAWLLFLLQLFHLYWLFTDIILQKLTGESYFVFPYLWGAISALLDYTEIPAIISTTILYIHLLRKQFDWKKVWFLFALNIQWLYLFWITDEMVVERFSRHELLHWNIAIAWIAILIDYLELPVMWDTSKRLYRELKTKISNYSNF